MSAGDPELEAGWVDVGLASELPGLALVTTTAPAPHGRPSRAVRRRLRDLSDRWHGARAVTVRREPVPHAYRVLFRHLALDPDEQRTPIEAAVVDRLLRGGFRAQGALDAALLLALVETSVPVWAVDAERIDGPLGLRPAGHGERLGEGELAHDVVPGRIVVADARGPVAVLFGDMAADVRPGPATTTVRLFAVVAPGVGALHVEEALWTAAEALGEAGAGR